MIRSVREIRHFWPPRAFWTANKCGLLLVPCRRFSRPRAAGSGWPVYGRRNATCTGKPVVLSPSSETVRPSAPSDSMSTLAAARQIYRGCLVQSQSVPPSSGVVNRNGPRKCEADQMLSRLHRCRRRTGKPPEVNARPCCPTSERSAQRRVARSNRLNHKACLPKPSTCHAGPYNSGIVLLAHHGRGSEPWSKPRATCRSRRAFRNGRSESYTMLSQVLCPRRRCIHAYRRRS